MSVPVLWFCSGRNGFCFVCTLAEQDLTMVLSVTGEPFLNRGAAMLTKHISGAVLVVGAAKAAQVCQRGAAAH